MEKKILLQAYPWLIRDKLKSFDVASKAYLLV